MASVDNITRFYPRQDFLALGGNVPIELFASRVLALNLSIPVLDVRLTPQQHGVLIVLAGFATEADRAALDNLVATFIGGATTRAPIEVNSFAAATSTSNTHTNKVDHTSPALDGGTYQVVWNSSIRMASIGLNSGVEGKIVVRRSDGVSVTQADAWDLNVNHAFNGALTFVCLPGQTIQATLSFARLGLLGVAEMSGARVTIDRMG